MIKISELVHFVVHTQGLSMQMERHGYHDSLPVRKVRDAPVSKGTKQQQKTELAEHRKKTAEKNEQWSQLDSAFASEFKRLGGVYGYSEDHSCVPAGYVPKRSAEMKKADELGRLLAGEETRSGAAAKLAQGESAKSAVEKPEPGDPVNERAIGFWPMCYPELFPYGIGCFNEPRQVPVTFDEWVSWALYQDSRALAPPTAQPSNLDVSAQIDAATQARTPVSFRGVKKKGTKCGLRWVRYSTCTTIADAFAAGATRGDIVYDFQHGLMTIANLQCPPPVVGSGDMVHMTHKLFPFHIFNCNIRSKCDSASRAYVKQLPCGYDDSQIAEHLKKTDPEQLQKELLSFSHAIPNSAPFFMKRRKELKSMTDELGQPTFFVTASAADTQCPHLHKLIVQWNGFAGTTSDPFVPGISQAEVYQRKAKNLADNPTAASYFWDKKASNFREQFLPLLGVTAHWERTEYQARGSAHGHALWWHPEAPPDEFLDLITEFAVALVTKEALETKEGGGEVELDGDRAAHVTNLITSASPIAFVYDGDFPLFVTNPDAAPADCFHRAFAADVRFTGSTMKKMHYAARYAWAAARWYDDFLDASNRHYDDAARQVVDGFMGDNAHPSSLNPVEVAANQPFGWQRPSEASALPDDHAATLAIEDDYQVIRCKTARHSVCLANYCLRKDSKTKEDYCRFAEGLAIRGGDYGFKDAPSDQVPGPVDEVEEKNDLPVARSHFYCKPVTANDDTTVLRSQFYVRKTDPRINSCCPTHARCFRSNVDAKACVDKYGVCAYVTKFANYCSKPETKSANFQNLLSAKLSSTVPGAAAHAPCRSLLFDVCKRDYSAQEVSAINLKFKSVACSHEFISCRWSGDYREANPAAKKGDIETRLNQREIYFNRRRIIDAQKQRALKSKKGLTKKASLEFDAMKIKIMSASFIDFYKCYDADFKPASKRKAPLWERYEIIMAPNPESRVPVLVPDLPLKLRVETHPDHERYCEFRLFTLKPWDSQENWDDFVSSAQANRNVVEQIFAQEIEQKNARENADGKSCAQRAPGLAPGGVFHDAYDTFMKESTDSLHSRTGRLLQGDDAGHAAEIDVGNNDEDVKDPLHYGNEDWMGNAKSEIKAIEDLQYESTVGQAYWDNILAQYQSGVQNLGDDWIKEMAENGVIIPAPAEDPVDVSSLNDEQQCLLRTLTDHYDATVAAARSGGVAPKPLRLVVYGKGGTGKTHVLRAFREYVDQKSTREHQDIGDVDDEGNERVKCPLQYPRAWQEPQLERSRDLHKRDYAVVHKNQAPLTSADIICAMAPSAQAAIAVGGDTIQGACSFPRTVGNTRIKDGALEITDAARRTLEGRHNFSEYYFVDEFGMMGAEQMGVCEKRIRQAHTHTMGEKPFGQRSIILFGHHAQLPPVNDKRAFADKKGLTGIQQAGITAYSELFKDVIILRQQRRQRVDVSASGLATPENQQKQRRVRLFKGFLDRVESCTLTANDFLALNRHSQEMKDSGRFDVDDPDVSLLCARKADKQRINLAQLFEHSKATGNPIVRIDAEHKGNSYAAAAKSNDANGLEPHIYLAKGAKVMCSWNGWKKAGLVNGAVGTVFEIIYAAGVGPPSVPLAILVQFPTKVYRGPSFLGEDTPGIVKFTAITETYVDPATKRPNTVAVSCSRTQFPLHLAYAMTIHKSQGQTLGKVLADAGPTEFDAGLMYTLFSRVRDWNDICLSPMPTFKRMTSWRSKLKERIAHEGVLEELFFQTATSRLEAVRNEVPGIHDPRREEHFAKLVNGQLSCFIPSGWRNSAPTAHFGGGVVALPNVLRSFCSHIVLRKHARENVTARKQACLGDENENGSWSRSRMPAWDPKAGRRDWTGALPSSTVTWSLEEGSVGAEEDSCQTEPRQKKKGAK